MVGSDIVQSQIVGPSAHSTIEKLGQFGSSVFASPKPGRNATQGASGYGIRGRAARWWNELCTFKNYSGSVLHLRVSQSSKITEVPSGPPAQCETKTIVYERTPRERRTADGHPTGPRPAPRRAAGPDHDPRPDPRRAPRGVCDTGRMIARDHGRRAGRGERMVATRGPPDAEAHKGPDPIGAGSCTSPAPLSSQSSSAVRAAAQQRSGRQHSGPRPPPPLPLPHVRAVALQEAVLLKRAARAEGDLLGLLHGEGGQYVDRIKPRR